MSGARLQMRPGALATDERELAGRITGVLYAAGGVSALLLLLLPGVPRDNWPIVLAAALGGLLWCVLALGVVDWERTPSWVTHASTLAGFPITVLTVLVTGGDASPARFFLLFIVLFVAWFYRPAAAAAYIGASVLVHGTPLLYSDPVADQFYGEWLVVSLTYVVLGVAIRAGKRLMVDLRHQAEQLAEEHGALRRVATEVAAGHEAEDLHVLVAREAARLLGGEGGQVLRFNTPTEAQVLGAWAAEATRAHPVGTVVPVSRTISLGKMMETGSATIVDEHPAGGNARRLGYASTIIGPVRVGDELWGALAVGSTRPRAFGAADADRLVAFAELIATAIQNAEDRKRLSEQASCDPLTGLVNHRTFHERLGAEVARAQRHGRSLSLAVLDVDDFKAVNDTRGHEHGDALLATLANRLRAAARAEDTLARIGGDEFAWILPESGRMEALAAVEAARSRLVDDGVSVTAGICDLELAHDSAELFRFADGALYWGKAHGRDVAWVFDPSVVQELSAGERAERLERSQALLGLRALARAIDAKDPSTRQHSERVADLSARLAEVRGWAPDRVALLREAALVHDVGKIGVPDAVLLKPGPLTPEEYDLIKGHAALSAQIVEDVLAPEQVEWIHAHHERPDGLGYPLGVTTEGIPEGAALLALADSWDVMTASRPYSVPKEPAAALQECSELVGAQFTPAAVAALEECIGPLVRRAGAA